MKLYTGRDVDVSFDLSLCVHCQNCLTTLPAVFQLDRKPWVPERRVEDCEGRMIASLLLAAACRSPPANRTHHIQQQKPFRRNCN